MKMRGALLVVVLGLFVFAATVSIGGDGAEAQTPLDTEEKGKGPVFESSENGGGQSILRGTEGAENTFYGTNAGKGNTGSRVTFMGAEAGAGNNTGNQNTFMGYEAGTRNTDGKENTFMGYKAGCENTHGEANTFVGNNTGFYNTDGSDNTFVGARAGALIRKGHYNTFVGQGTGAENYEGSYNAFFGVSAGANCISGRENVFMGVYAGYRNVNGVGNVFIGYEAGQEELGSNKLYIDNSATDAPLIYGEFDNNLVRINGNLRATATAASSDRRLKKDIQPLQSALQKAIELKGVSYKWNLDEYPDKGLCKGKQIGLIAQDVEAVLPELVETDSDGYKSVSYAKLTAVLLEAIKALKVEDEKQSILFENWIKEQDVEIEELRALIKKPKS